MPPDSRCIKKLEPVESWTLSDEIASQILQELRVLNVSYYNTHRRKTAKAQKVSEQLQPDYVKEAVEQYKAIKASEKAKDIDEDTKAFLLRRAGISKPVEQITSSDIKNTDSSQKTE